MGRLFFARWPGRGRHSPDRHPFGNREFGVYFQSRGCVHLCAAPVGRSHAGQLYEDTPGGVVQPGQWYHVAAVLSAAWRWPGLWTGKAASGA